MTAPHSTHSIISRFWLFALAVIVIFATITVAAPAQAATCISPSAWAQTRVGQSIQTIESRLNSTGKTIGSGRSNNQEWRKKRYMPICGTTNVAGEVFYVGQVVNVGGRFVFKGTATSVRSLKVV